MSTTEGKHPGALALIKNFACSSVGAKVLMALTGALMWLFVLQHMVMNLQALLPMGAYPGELINDYAHKLKSMGPIVWIARFGLLATLGLHVVSAMRLVYLNKNARQNRYAMTHHKKAGIASKLMPYTGIALFIFIVFHIFHFTAPVRLDFLVDMGVLPDGWQNYLTYVDQKGQPDVYKMVREGFSAVGVVAFYFVAMLALFAHLYHGTVSLWQSLGLRHTRWTPVLRFVGMSTAGLILAGDLLIPLYIFLTYGLSK